MPANTLPHRGPKLLNQTSITNRFEYRFAVSFTGTSNGILRKPLEVLRTIRAGEEKRALARKTEV
jgi:hypothetical protein